MLRGLHQTVKLSCGCYKHVKPQESEIRASTEYVPGCAEADRLWDEWENTRRKMLQMPEEAWPTEAVQGPLKSAEQTYFAHFEE